MTNRILLEVCIETAEDAKAAFAGGADRLEVCSRLDLGGLTPDREEFRRIRDAVPLPLLVMIRSRGGDFAYSESEVKSMEASLEEFLPLQPAGFVFGASTSSLARRVPKLDTSLAHRVPKLDTSLAHRVPKTIETRCAREDFFSWILTPIHESGLQSVFHRAFNEANEPLRLLEALIGLGFTRVLTSGCHRTAFEGRERIAELNRIANGRIEILPGAGVRPENAVEILRTTGCRQIHGSFSANGRTDSTVVRAVRIAVDQFAAIASG